MSKVMSSSFSRIARRSFTTTAARLNGAASEEVKIPLAALNARTVTSDPTVKNFFKYTWGTWLENDAGEKAKRETPFNVMGLVEVLNQKLKPKDPATPIEIKTIASHSEGSHHKAYKVDVANVAQEAGQSDDLKQLILRIPYPGVGSYAYLSNRLKSEVATMEFVQKSLVETGKASFKIPKVHAWAENPKTTPVESQFILMDYIESVSLAKYWEPGSQDLKAKQVIMKPIVDAYADLAANFQFNKYGSLYFIEDVDKKDQNDLPVAGDIPKEVLDKFRIGPSTEAHFWNNELPASSPLRGPWSTPAEYIQATGQILVDSIKETMRSYHDVPVQAHLEKQLKAAERFAKAAPELLLESELDPELFSGRLAHADLNPHSFFYLSSEVSSAEDIPKSVPYLIDFESTAIKPFILQGTPFFARNDGLKIFSKDEVPNYDKLSPTEKQTVDHCLAMTQNQFSFEYMLMQSKLGKSSPGLINAFAPIVKYRQQPFYVAQTKNVSDVQGKSLEYLDLEQSMLQLKETWDALLLNRENPISFTEDEVKAHTEAYTDYSKKMLSNPFLGSNGWIPQDLFEKLLGQGMITKKDNGDYDIEYKW